MAPRSTRFPKTGLAQTIPVIKARDTNTTPTSAAAWASPSHRSLRLIKNPTLPISTRKNDRKDTIAIGT